MNSSLVAALVALSLVAITPALAQEAVPQAKGDNVPVNLPPLILTSPSDVAITVEGETHSYRLGTSDFLVVDDGSSEASVSCTINEVTEEIHDNYNAVDGGGYGPVWELADGSYPVLCAATDEAGLRSSVTYNLTIHAVVEFVSSEYESKIKRIAYVYERGNLSAESYAKVLKYFHRAGLLSFDIERDGERPSGNECRNHDRLYTQHAKSWRSGYPTWTNLQYQTCLGHIAESGYFDRINLGF